MCQFSVFLMTSLPASEWLLVNGCISCMRFFCLCHFFPVVSVSCQEYKCTICLACSGLVTSYWLLVSVCWLEHLLPITGHLTRRYMQILFYVSMTFSICSCFHCRMCHGLLFSELSSEPQCECICMYMSVVYGVCMYAS